MLLLLASLISLASAQTFTALPNNSNVIRVTGTGFNVSSAVTLRMFNETELIYTFPEQTATDANGGFSNILIVPTSISGVYNITANTTGVTMTVQNFRVPDLRGTRGEIGFNGTQGEVGPQGPIGLTGEKGEDGLNADNTMVYASLITSLSAAFGVMLFAIAMRSRFGEKISTTGKWQKTVTEEEQAETMMKRAERGDKEAIIWLLEHGYEQA